MNFRNATINDLEEINIIENSCFPQNEAATFESLSSRLKVFPNHFWILENNNNIIGYINGMITNNKTIHDEMFVKVDLHDEHGGWQSVFSLAVSPDYRNKGYATKLINHLIEKSKEQKRVGITLTCKEYLIPYYNKFSFVDLGISNSVHGGEIWHDMIIEF